MSEDIVLKTTDLTKHYGGVHALEGANFELRKGEHVAIMGRYGTKILSSIRMFYVNFNQVLQLILSMEIS